ncbi:unnamed protein product [Closterium sp. Yama58-4]|nr:unnamed protein product [Closterium sp. Yama58-4]
MRGGKFQQKVVEDGSTRNSESLFETRSIADIVAIEARTRKEVEEKKEELRQLVGASYRHLIESADSILDMRRSCEAVVRNVAAMESDFTLLHKTISTTATTTPAADAKRKRKEALYALGSRVKYLVDTPEKIWGCLDERMFLEAAQRFMRAWEVHQLLSPSLGSKGAGGGGGGGAGGGGGGDGTAAGGWQAQQQGLMASFPLLRHQWPLVETFRTQIVERSRECLHDASRIPAAGVGEYAAALAAVAVMEELSSHDLLSLFLDARRACLRSQLASATLALGAGGSFADALATLLSQLVAMIQLTLCQTGQLFLEVSSAERAVLLGVLLQGAPQAQLFGGIPRPDRELALWHTHRDALEARLPSLSSKEVAEACQDWLKACAADIAAESKNLLSRVTQIRHLAQAEAATRAAITNKDIFAASLDWLTSAFGSPPESPWRALCELLLKEPKDLWSELFEAAFALRAREIIDEAFAGLTLREEIDGVLREVGDVVAVAAVVSAENAAAAAAGAGAGAAGAGAAGGGAAVVTAAARAIASEKAAGLAGGGRRFGAGWATLPPLTDVIGQAGFEETGGFAVGEAVWGSPGEELGAVGLDAANAAGRLSAQVAVEQALLIGRLAAAVAQSSSSLAVALGPSSTWPAVAAAAAATAGGFTAASAESTASGVASEARGVGGGSGRRGGRRMTDLAAVAARSAEFAGLHEIQRELRRLSILAHSHWVTHSTRLLASAFRRNLMHDPALTTATPLKVRFSFVRVRFSLSPRGTSLLWNPNHSHRHATTPLKAQLKPAPLYAPPFPCVSLPYVPFLQGWEETVVQQEGEEGEAKVEMRMTLPACPSPYVASLLFAASADVHRVGCHSLDRLVLRLFAWELSDQVLAAYEALASTKRASEKGVLQLLFDARLLSDVLSGGAELPLEALRAISGAAAQGGAGGGARAGAAANRGAGAGAAGGAVARAGSGGGAGAGAGAGSIGVSVAARKKRVAALLEKLQEELDPIDRAAYLPFLWQNQQRFYLRSAVLFGHLAQLHRLYTDATPRHPYATDANTLDTAPTVPRFTFLPISSPLLANGGLAPGGKPRRPSTFGDVSLSVSGSSSNSGAPVSRVPSGAGAGAAAAASGVSGGGFGGVGSGAWGEDGALGGAFSFADSTGLSATPIFKSLMGQVKLGSILGDGSQVTRNISNLQEMFNQPSQAAGLFSSLTSAAAGSSSRLQELF